MTPEELEHRSDRPYDESDPSRILHPNGTRLLTSDRDLSGAMTRHVLALYRGQRSCQPTL